MDLSMIYAYPKTEKLITHQFFNHQSQNLIYLDLFYLILIFDFNGTSCMCRPGSRTLHVDLL